MADDPASRRRKFKVLSCTVAVGVTGQEPAAAQEKGDYTLGELTAMALATLPLRQREALRMLYGVGRSKVRQLRRAAEELGTTTERVRHLEKKGFATVRELIYSRGTRPSARPPAAPAGGYGLLLYRKLEETLATLPPAEEEVLRLRSGFGHPGPAGIDAACAAAGLGAPELRALEGRGKRRLGGEAKLLLKLFGDVGERG